MYKPVMALAIVIFFSSCKKSTTAILEGNYIAESTLSVGGVILYSRNYSTTDATFIQAYLNRTGLPAGYFSFINPDTLPSTYAIHFNPNNQVTIFDSTAIINAEITSETDSTVIISEIDSLTTWWPTNPGWALQIFKKTTLVQPQMVCTPVPSGYSCRFRRVFVLRKINRQLYLPLMTYQARVGTYTSYAGWNVNNIFNPSVLNELLTTDTLVVQQKRTRLIKQ